VSDKTVDTQQEYEDLVGNVGPIQRIKELAEKYNENCYDIGCVLFHLKENDIYKTIDGSKYYSDKHTKWKGFCEENLSISYRTAQYWLNLYRYFIAEMGMSKTILQELGWSKAKELIDITDDPDKLSELVMSAKTMTINDLRATIVDFLQREGQDNREITKFKSFNFRLPEMQSEHAAEILDLAAKSCDGDRNQAFFKIFLEWFQFNNPVSEQEKNTYLVNTDTLDDNGEQLPESILSIL
jgi:hypothetical protein